jgi:hypothetical protein
MIHDVHGSYECLCPDGIVKPVLAMREVLQLRLTCVKCTSVTVIAILPWAKSRGPLEEGPLKCSCGNSVYAAFLIAATVPE